VNLVAKAIPPTLEMLSRTIDVFAIYGTKIPIKILPKSFPKPSKSLENPPKIVPKSISDATKDFLGTTLDSSLQKV
jgi:hypothetical protein